MIFDTIAGSARTFFFSDPGSGLRAILCVDDLTLGPAAGGIRTRAYANDEDAFEDARRLAAAMTLKCAIAGLDAGGAKTVVIDHPGLRRDDAFKILGRRIAELGGMYHCASDYGTTDDDLEAVRTETRFVHTGAVLGGAVARGLVRCVQAVAETRGVAMADLRVAVQGCGVIGDASARALVDAGAQVLVCDVDAARANRTAAVTGNPPIDPETFIEADVDVLAPCATGDAIDAASARRMRAWGLCGAANNIVVQDARPILVAREIVHVPDIVASAGAVIEGIGRGVMGLSDPGPLIDALGDTAKGVVAVACGREPADLVAERLATARIDAARAR